MIREPMQLVCGRCGKHYPKIQISFRHPINNMHCEWVCECKARNPIHIKAQDDCDLSIVRIHGEGKGLHLDEVPQIAFYLDKEEDD